MKINPDKPYRYKAVGLVPVFCLLIVLESCNTSKKISPGKQDLLTKPCDCSYYQSIADREYSEFALKPDNSQKNIEEIKPTDKIQVNKQLRRPAFLYRATRKQMRRKKPGVKHRDHSWTDLFRKNISSCPNF